MAENKKGFVLYADLIHTVSELPNEIKGKLFQLILDYVNDLNPEPNDLILKIAFNPIKLQLKRDLKIWESKIKQRSEAGKASAKVRSTKSTTVESRSTNPTVIVNVKDTVTVKDKVIKKIFAPPTLEEFKSYFFENGFSLNLAERAWRGYDAAQWHDTKGNKIRNWKQKCQNVWFKSENKEAQSNQKTVENYEQAAMSLILKHGTKKD